MPLLSGRLVQGKFNQSLFNMAVEIAVSSFKKSEWIKASLHGNRLSEV